MCRGSRHGRRARQEAILQERGESCEASALALLQAEDGQHSGKAHGRACSVHAHCCLVARFALQLQRLARATVLHSVVLESQPAGRCRCKIRAGHVRGERCCIKRGLVPGLASWRDGLRAMHRHHAQQLLNSVLDSMKTVWFWALHQQPLGAKRAPGLQRLSGQVLTS